MTISSGRVRHAIGTTFQSLQHRNFRLFFNGQTISNTGNWLTNVAITLLVLKLTHSGIAVGALAACQYGPMLLFSAYAGAVADGGDKRRFLFVTQGLEMAQSCGLAVLAFLPHPSIVGLFILAAFGGTLLAFDNPLRRSFVTEMVPSQDIPNAVVLYSIIVNVSRIFGPALAGLLVVTLGYGWCFTIDAVSYLAVLVCLYMMRTSELRRAPSKGRRKGAVIEGLRYVRSLPVLWIPFVMLTVVCSLAYNFNVTLPLFVTDGLHGSDGDFTLIYSVFSFGAVVGALIVANRSFVGLRHIVRGSAMFSVALLLFAAVPSVMTAYPVVFFVGVASILYMTATTAIVQVEAKPEMHGRVLALQTVILGGSAAIGGPILGAIADAFGARSVMVIGGLACVAATVFGVYAERTERERPTVADELEHPSVVTAK